MALIETSHPAPHPEAAPRVERTNHSTQVYLAAYGELVTDPDARVIFDIGAGDSPFAADMTDDKRTVYRVDPQYTEHPPADTRNIFPTSVEQGIPVEDGTADRVVSSFVFQHLAPGQVKSALTEMLRITKPEEGYVGIFPVFRPKGVNARLQELNLGDARVGFLGGKQDETELARRGLHYPTLLVRNNPALREPDESGQSPLDGLLAALQENKALQPRPTMSRLIRNLRMRLTGNNDFRTPGR